MTRLVWWLQWHRRLGVAVAVIVLMLALTGILINHSQSMGWHKQPVYSPLVAWLYGVPMQAVQTGYTVDEHWFTQVGDKIFRDRHAIQECHGGLKGVVAFAEMLAVLCEHDVMLLDADGQLIEFLRGIPGQPEALAVTADMLWARTSQGLMAYSDETATWKPQQSATELQWSTSQPLPAKLATHLTSLNPIPGISREQVLLDLHSGRLFGFAGVLVVDLVGVVVCLLAFSGLLTWVGRKRRQRKRR